MNPYEVLGVSSNATDAEIKAAYYDAVRKYHPDQYKDNPLSDLAEEKLKEINQAYDEIQKMRGGSSGGSNNSTYAGNNVYSSVRAKINAGDINGAEAILNGMQANDAEWYYLKGVIFRMRGWHEEANRYFAQSYSMNPNNGEYARAYQEGNARTAYYTRNAGRSGDSTCNCLSSLCLADCCCECLGGDLITCC